MRSIERFAEEDLRSFLLRLTPEQERLINQDRRGPILVRGGPGTGKSTLALYQVQRLLRLDVHLPLRLNRQIAIGAGCAVAFDVDRQFVLFAVEFNDIAALILDGDRWRAITVVQRNNRPHQDLF